jgi:hypothetical protein
VSCPLWSPGAACERHLRQVHNNVCDVFFANLESGTEPEQTIVFLNHYHPGEVYPNLTDRILSAWSRRARCPASGAYQSRSLEIFGAPDIGTFEYEQAKAEQEPSSIWMMRRPLT